jgi:hypothetical protein
MDTIRICFRNNIHVSALEMNIIIINAQLSKNYKDLCGLATFKIDF